MKTANDIRIIQSEYNSDQYHTKAHTIVEQIADYVKDTTKESIELSYRLDKSVIDILQEQGFTISFLNRSRVIVNGGLLHKEVHTVISWSGDLKVTQCN